ncbi:MAG TPA: hypothetical protein VFY41_07560 [Nitrososphaeraceae archaeon]|nr:hypothetical protein [Nitrososphaeraceae archaeon]
MSFRFEIMPTSSYTSSEHMESIISQYQYYGLSGKYSETTGIITEEEKSVRELV